MNNFLSKLVKNLTRSRLLYRSCEYVRGRLNQIHNSMPGEILREGGDRSKQARRHIFNHIYLAWSKR